MRGTVTKEVPIWLGPANNFLKAAQEHKTQSSQLSSVLINGLVMSDGVSSAMRAKKTQVTDKKLSSEY